MNSDHFYVVGIGASAGGHPALRNFFLHLPPDLPAAFVVITHLLRGHKSSLASIIARYTRMPVHSISEFTSISKSTVYVLQENTTAEIQSAVLVATPRPETGANRAIDIFFNSMAKSCGERAVGIVLSGMGSDGAEGCMNIFRHNGTVMVQEPSTAQFSSMPWSAIIKDHPDVILPPAALASRLALLLMQEPLRVVH